MISTSQLRLFQSHVFPERMVIDYKDLLVTEIPSDSVDADEERPLVYFHSKQPQSVVDFFKASGFRVSDSNLHFNICFGEPYSLDFYKSMVAGQLISQFPGCNAVAQKATFCRYVKTAASRRQEFRGLIPASWVIPEESQLFEQCAEKHQFYIYKPSLGSEGKGIHVFEGLRANWVDLAEPAVIEEYVGDIMLINGRKFDLRLYVMLTSVCPLIIYFYKDGLVRFATDMYEPATQANCAKKTMHLTNFAINYPTGGADVKWSFSTLLQYINSNVDVSSRVRRDFQGQSASDAIVAGIRKSIIYTLIALEPRYIKFGEKAGNLYSYPRKCFALYGFDVLLRTDGTPLILEVNKCPNKDTKTEIDREIKFPLLQHTLNLVGYSFVKNESHTIVKTPERMDPEIVNTHRPKEENYTAPAFSDFHEEDAAQCTFAVKELTHFEKRALLQLVDEEQRMGQFERIYPDGDTAKLELFEEVPYLDRLFCWWARNGSRFLSDLLECGVECDY